MFASLPHFELRFESLFAEGHALVFPSDASGRVDLDALPPRARSNYLYARGMVGRDYAMPKVLVTAADACASQTRSEASPLPLGSLPS